MVVDFAYAYLVKSYAWSTEHIQAHQALHESRHIWPGQSQTRYAARTRFPPTNRPPLSPSRARSPPPVLPSKSPNFGPARTSIGPPMATKCAAAADLPAARPRKRARHGWDVAPPTKVNAPISPLNPPPCSDPVCRFRPYRLVGGRFGGNFRRIRHMFRDRDVFCQ
ncbi:hypothetical protein ACQ4PT_021289 [Festuca glaucescens]